MGAPAGNQNARKKKIVSDACIREIKQRDLQAGDGETVRQMVAALVDKALAGDIKAFIEFRDTVDGTPVRTISGDEDAPGININVRYPGS